MTWFKVDDSFYDHPKAFDAPDCALALWLRAGTWSARNLTDGFVPSRLPARFCDDPDTAIKELIHRGLWIRTSGGYRFHDWHDYQPSKADVEDLRAKRAEAGKRGGQARAAKQNASKSQASATHVAKQNPTPARPDPAFKGGNSVGVTTDRARASPEPPPRCPEHENTSHPPPCGACADARRAADRWRADRDARVAAAPRCDRHPGETETNCRLCRSEQLGAA